MAVIPQYNAANPATPRGPVLERERRARIDNGAALRGLNEVANELSQGGVEIPNIDPETGQAGARAIMSVGDGLRRVGGVIAEIREREAEARDYREVHEARMAMEREAAEFEIWQQTNRDPKTWEEESRRRIESFSTRYFDDRELSPRAERDIRMRMESFANRQAVNVGVAAVKEHTKLAREALEADIVRAKTPQDAAAMAQYGVQQGWFPADYAARLEVDAVNRMEMDALERAELEINTHLLNGNIEAVREGIRSLDIPEEEKRFKLAEFENRHAENIVAEEINNQIFENPKAAINRLEAQEDPELGAAKRDQLKRLAYEFHREQRTGILSGVVELIDSKGIQTKEELLQSLWGAEASESELAMLEARMAGELLESAKEVQAFHSKIENYQPQTDPYGTKLSAIETEILLSVPPGEAQQRLFSELQQRASGETFTPGQEFVKRKREEHNSIVDAAATYRVPAKTVEEVEVDGQTVYVDTSSVPDPSDPFYFKTDTNGKWFGGKVEGRRLVLSQKDRLELEAKKKSGGYVEDITQMNEQLGAGAKQLDQFQERIDSGELKTDGEAEDAFKAITSLPRKEGAAAVLDSSLFPSGGPAATSDEEEAWLRGYDVNF